VSAGFADPIIVEHLSRSDPVMARIVRAHGPCGLRPERTGSPFVALATAVIHQQLHAKAAQTILGRVIALGGGRTFPTPASIPGISAAAFRQAGLSAAKTAAIRDLAAKALDGTLPSGQAIRHLTDGEIIERCTQARGVGRWTVEMLLIFRLGRPDVLPIDDYGVRNGARIAYGLSALPKPKELATMGEPWRPWRSVAAWYLWRVADASKG
jgi:DNA-3-methyladenine glycosylase II